MDVPATLRAAAELATPGFRTEAERTLDDIRQYLDQDEWELALGMLGDVSDEHPQPAGFWRLLEQAAEGMEPAEGNVAWCRWRGRESLQGAIRAELVLATPEDGGRRSRIAGAGVHDFLWDIAQRAHTGGEPALLSARVWVEYATGLEPGQSSSVRLAPLEPARWRDLVPGDFITMYEAARPAGLAEVLSVIPPVAD